MRYRVREFAALTGVTVRTLQHYDRVGLLTPARTDSGYRVYSVAERVRLRRIMALRAIGFSLQQIGRLLEGPAAVVAAALDAQCVELERTRIDLDDRIDTLRRFDSAADSSDAMLDRLTSALEMKDVLREMRGYFSPAAWERWGRGYFEDWPSSAWRTLFREIESALDEDPSSPRAQDLLDRSMTLWNAGIGSDDALARAVRAGYGKAWSARHQWPAELRRRCAAFKIEAIAKFLGDASLASWRRRGLVQTYTAGRSIASGLLRTTNH